MNNVTPATTEVDIWIVYFACMGYWCFSMVRRDFSIAFAIAMIAMVTVLLISSGVVK